MDGTARVVCVQLAPVVGALDDNCDAMLAAVAAVLARGGDVIVLPELATSGYVFASKQEAASVAITPRHEVFARVAAELAGSAAVCAFGFAEMDGTGTLYNSAAVVDASGVRVVYRKTHLWDTEKLVFTAGSDAPPVLQTDVGVLGLLICYDLEFPEMTRALALAGADLILVPTNWPLVERPQGERAPEVVIAMAAARSSKVAIACCDRTGTERGQEWTAGTTIIGCDGWVHATPGSDSIAVTDLVLADARDKRISERNDIWVDRRPDVYDAAAAALRESSAAAGPRR